jgi:ferredoxin
MIETKPKSIVIYCFSGTGNALTASQWVADEAIKNEIQVTIHLIDHLIEVDKNEVEKADIIGFTYPTHGFNAPPIMLKFFFRFCKTKEKPVFFLNTRGGCKIWRLHVPGLSGWALLFPMLVMAIKGYKTVGVLPLDMPHSWISFFPPVNRAAKESIIKRCNKTVTGFTNIIINLKKSFRIKFWIWLPIDIPMLPIAFLYYYIGRFGLAKTLYPDYNCDNCRICEQNCPVGAIEIVNNKPFWKLTCESCMRCMNICPKKSIQSWVTRMALFLWVLLAWPYYDVIKYLTELISTGSFISHHAAYWIMLTIASILLIPLYRLLQYVLHWSYVNKIITYTSLTKLYGRYLAPGIKAVTFKKYGK